LPPSNTVQTELPESLNLSKIEDKTIGIKNMILQDPNNKTFLPQHTESVPKSDINKAVPGTDEIPDTLPPAVKQMVGAGKEDSDTQMKTLMRPIINSGMAYKHKLVDEYGVKLRNNSTSNEHESKNEKTNVISDTDSTKNPDEEKQKSSLPVDKKPVLFNINFM